MSLTLQEARQRAAALSDVSYAVHLDLTDPQQGTFGCRTTVRFRSAVEATFLELTAADDLRVEVDGAAVEPAYDGRRLPLTALSTDRPAEVVVDARLPYVTDGDGMHVFTDPADGETYVSAYVGMDIAQKVFACFDQNDLKAPIDLTVTADPAWTVLANGRAVGHDARAWRFARTPPIPTAMFVVCAGPWHSVTWEHAGLPFGWHARRSLAAELERDAADLRRVTEACFDHYTSLFAEPYPFDSYDQALVPGQNWGALETPGCVTYRDEMLPRGVLTDRVRTHRTTVIAHEMAHMWFGDLVTMTWWEDTWLQESFADYMGFRVAAEAAGVPAALVSAEAVRKPTAFDADSRRSTHPVAPDAEEVPDVDAAANNFDMISYAKGNAVVRQLATWLGDEEFLTGLDAYLTRHRFGNATLADFLAALDEASDRDVAGWGERWLRTTGFDTLTVTRDGDVPVLGRVGSRPHRLRVTAYDDRMREVGSRLVDVADEPVRLAEWAGRVVVPNSHGETYAALALDETTSTAVSERLSDVADDVTRAVLWTHLFLLARRRELAADALLEVVARHLPHERHVGIVGSVLGRTLRTLVPQRVSPAEAPAALDLVADACRRGLAVATDPQVRIELTDGLATTSREPVLLRQWLVDGRTDEGVELHPALRWRVVRRMAELGALDEPGIDAEQRRDGTVEGELGAAAALAARPTEAAKAAAWAAVAEDDDVSNRMLGALTSGLWSVEQPDLEAPYVSAYLAEAPRLARRGQAFAQEVHRAFPALPLTAAQVAELEEALRGDLPPVLRRGWEDRLDDLR